MLVITDYEDNEYSLHLGDKMPDNPEWVVSLQADGDELLAIQEQFSNIPMHSGRVVKWWSETASFIATNLKLEYKDA